MRTRKLTSVTLAAWCIVAVGQAASAQAAIPSDSAIRAIIRERVDSKLATGIVVGVLEADGRRRYVAYGASGTARPLDENSVFEIGSITKTFTAAVLADMVAHGEVDLYDPVAKFLPASVHVPTRGGRQITLVDLATQSSGLPRMPTNFNPRDAANPFADYTPSLLYAFLSSYQLTRDIGAEYEYSNVGVGLLGHALTLRAGTDLETLYRRRVLDPLHMNDTRIALTPALRQRLALGHDAAGALTPNWDLDALAGAGALRSTVSDMLTYLAANIAADIDSARSPLATALHNTHTVRRSAGGETSIGLAWHVSPTPTGGHLVWHNGGTGGYRTFAGYDATAHTGVVVLTNSSSSPDDIAAHLLAPSIPLKPPVVNAVANRTAIILPAATLDRYVGDYELAPQFHIAITHEGNGLVAEPTGQGKAPLFAERERDFFLRVVDAQITFEVDAAGKTVALVLHQNGRDLRGVKVR